MREEKPKAAYIDYTTNGTLMLLELRIRGIKIIGSDTLERFKSQRSLEEYPVLLFHPGVDNQQEIGQVRAEYPKLVVAVVTSPLAGGDYKALRARGSDLRVFYYNEVDEIERFIRENQARGA